MLRLVIPIQYLSLHLIALVLLPVARLSATPPQPIPYNDHLAPQLAEQILKQVRLPYAGTDRQLPESLQQLDYDGYRRIVYQRSEAIDLHCVPDTYLELFHRGYLFKDRVKVNLKFADEPVQRLLYDPKLFRFHEPAPVGLTDGLDFAGLRLIYPLHGQIKPQKPEDQLAYLQSLNEIVSFIGASYFRAVDKGGAYGSSARGLAVNTGFFDRAEEFPVFTQFWVIVPSPADRNPLTLWALMQSPCINGFYQFKILPDSNNTTVEVSARLFPHKPIEKLGIAPLTSMFLYGESGANDDVHVNHRPEVHDADGLLVYSRTGEWLWHPLTNPQAHRVTRFSADEVQGYGLMQRDKNVKHYNDHETNQHLRPSIWVKPHNNANWGNGSIELLELASNGEGMDNIGAYWIPQQPVQPGEELAYHYALIFTHQQLFQHAPYQVSSTVSDIKPNGKMPFTVTFRPTALHKADTSKTPQATITAEHGNIEHVMVDRDTRDGKVTVRFTVHPTDQAPVNIRGFLHQGMDAVSETWSYTCPPNKPRP